MRLHKKTLLVCTHPQLRGSGKCSKFKVVFFSPDGSARQYLRVSGERLGKFFGGSAGSVLFYCSSLGHSCGMGWIPLPGASTCHRCSFRGKERKKEKYGLDDLMAVWVEEDEVLKISVILWRLFYKEFASALPCTVTLSPGETGLWMAKKLTLSLPQRESTIPTIYLWSCSLIPLEDP